MNIITKNRLIMESCIFFGALFYYLKTKGEIHKHKELIRFIKSAYVFTPHILIDVLNTQEKGIL